MKYKFTLLLLLFSTAIFYAQTNGIAYQAVFYKPNVKAFPGSSDVSVPMANTAVCLRFTFFDGANAVEYKETITTKTDEFGMVNTNIGTGIQSDGYAGSFKAIKWNVNNKVLKVELDEKGTCSSFTEISSQPFSSAPFAFNAITANNVSGIVSLTNGGTGANNSADALNNLGAENAVNKSRDVNSDAISDVKYPSVKAIKTYVDAKVVGGIPDATTIAAGKIMLAGDLSGTGLVPTVPGLLLKAAVDSPSFTGMPLAPSAVLGTNTTQIATTAFVTTAVANSTIESASSISEGKIQLSGDLAGTAAAPTVPGLMLKAAIDSPAFTGTPEAPSAIAGTNTAQIATTAFVTSAVANATIPNATSNGEGTIQLSGDLAGTSAAPTVPALVLKAAVDSPVFTGIPVAPAAALGTNTGQIATTSFVNTAVANATIASATANNEGKIQLSGDLSGLSTAPTVPGLLLKANVDSPVFTGIPAAPSAILGTNTTQVATTEFVTTAVANATIASATTSKEGKIMLSGDLAGTADAPTVPGLASKAGLNSPIFTGTPQAPTAAVGVNTMQLATTAFVTAAIRGVSLNVTVVPTDVSYTVLATDEIIIVNSVNGASVLTLAPNTFPIGKKLYIYNRGSALVNISPANNTLVQGGPGNNVVESLRPALIVHLGLIDFGNGLTDTWINFTAN